MTRREIIKRIGLSILAGLLISGLVSEFSYLLLRTPQDRGPQQILLTIPAGTAAMVAHGEVPPSIPSDMVFVAGDILLVRNLDSVAHELGPLYIPAGADASLHLDSVASYAYTCSFRPGQYIGLDVRAATTWQTRLLGI